MINDAGKGVYGIGVRGSRSWATIHPGYPLGLRELRRRRTSPSTAASCQAAMNSKAGKEITRSGSR